LVIIEDGSRIGDSVTMIKHADMENCLYLVFSVDSSKSISKKFLKSIKSSAREIARSVGSKDKIAVYQFDDSVILLNNFTQSSDEIVKNINDIERHGKKTLLYNSIYDSIELFDKVKQANKKVIVFTDGKDEGSSVSEEDIIKFARNAMIPVYFICCRDSKNLRSMGRISQRTGGKLIYGKSSDVSGMYRTTLSMMKNRYTVTYQSKLGMDGMNHRLEVRIKYKDIRDRDSDIFFIEKKRVTGSLLSFSSIIIIIVAILVLFMVLIVLFLYFMNREKEILKERFEIEKKYLMSQAAVEDDRVKKNGLVEGQDALSFGEEKTYGDAWLFQKNGPQVGKKYPINMREIIIGSGRDNAIVINDKTVSEKHSKIKIIQGMHTLFDLISDQGTYLNDKKLLRPKVLHDWDEIKIGSIVLIFRASQLKNS
ncbi:MAG TPA: FHA domain-containing protein, partial [Spirochaetota bacterium]|nr:FHA domain-containing protein [Spirochaetota bacterium]